MTQVLRQKKFKVEFTFTVDMDEVNPKEPEPSLSRQLQQVLLEDDTALTRVMIGAVLSKLQGYADYLAAQNNLIPFRKAAQELEEKHGIEVNISGDEIAQQTRHLRFDCMNVRMKSSVIHEEMKAGGDERQWQMVWQDLRPQSYLGSLFESLSIPTQPIPYTMKPNGVHSLRVRYLTNQKDGVHVEGRCTCEKAFEGTGKSECDAVDDLMNQYMRHLETGRLAEKFQIRWKNRIKPGNQ